LAEQRLVQTGEILFSGRYTSRRVSDPEGLGRIAAVSTILKRGQITGEVNQLSGRRSLVSAKRGAQLDYRNQSRESYVMSFKNETRN